MQWNRFDNPKESKWHLDGCRLVRGVETRNKQILPRRIVFDTGHHQRRNEDSNGAASSNAERLISPAQDVDRQNLTSVIYA